jgi:phage terminase large subunit-like protein
MPQKPPVDELEAFRKLAEGLQRQVTAPNIYRYVPHAKQREFHCDHHKERLFVAGNRSGKSLASVVEGIWYLTGTHPFRPTPPPPVRGRVVGVDFLNGIDKILLPLYKQWMPAEFLIEGQWEKSYSQERHTLTLNNGSFVEFMSQDQDLDKFAGTSRHFVHFDEECPKLIFDECLMRLIDTDGDWWISETPVSGMGWIYDELYEPAINGTKDIGLIEASMSDNTYLPKTAQERLLAMFTAEERLMRESGKYTTVTGQLFKYFRDKPTSEGGHILPEQWHPKRDPAWKNCRIYVTGDHGWNAPTAWLWVAVNQLGEMRIFHEWYQKETTVAEHAAEIHRYNKEWEIEPYLICGDPAMNQKSGLTGDSVVAEYARNGIQVQTKGITRDKLVGINKMNQYMMGNPRTGMPFMTISPTCPNTIREVKGAKQARIVNKLVAARKNAPEGIREKDDHTPDAIRYLITLLPDLTYKDFEGQGEPKWEDDARLFLGGYSTAATGIDRRGKSDGWHGWRDPFSDTIGLE